MANEMIVDTETGVKRSAGVAGASALVRRVETAMRAEVGNTPATGNEMTATHVRVEVTQGDNTQTWEATGDCSVTAEHEAVTTQRFGVRTMTVAFLAQSGMMRDFNADTLSAALMDYEAGNPAALCTLMGFSEEALAMAESVYADLARETVTTRNAAPRVHRAEVVRVTETAAEQVAQA